MSSAFDPAAARVRERETRLTGRSPDCQGEPCPGAWPEDGESLPCWPCYRDRDLRPAVPRSL